MRHALDGWKVLVIWQTCHFEVLVGLTTVFDGFCVEFLGVYFLRGDPVHKNCGGGWAGRTRGNRNLIKTSGVWNNIHCEMKST
jgi:hypothetical protein